jgi:hypothetical protein
MIAPFFDNRPLASSFVDNLIDSQTKVR